MIRPSTLLHQRVAGLVSEIKGLCPEAEILISYQPYETEDANLRVLCPEEWDLDQCDELCTRMAVRYSEILLNDGLSIIVLVIEPPERVRRENEAYLAALRQKAS